MSLEDMMVKIPKARADFRTILRSGASYNELKAFVLRLFDDCCGGFEERTLCENLMEEYKLHIDGLAA